jgi:hypothetical protein
VNSTNENERSYLRVVLYKPKTVEKVHFSESVN